MTKTCIRVITLLCLPLSATAQTGPQTKNQYPAILVYTCVLLLCLLLLVALLQWRQQWKKSKELETLNASRLDWLRIIAHDLRQPLRIYQGLAETLNYFQRKGDTEKVRQVSAQIDMMGEKIDLLLTNLLNWQSLQEKTIAVAEPVDLHTIFDELIPVYRQLAATRDLHIQTRFTTSLPIQVHAGSVQLLFRNLFDNAVKYGLPGTSIIITAEPREQKILVRLINQCSGRQEPHTYYLVDCLNKNVTLEPGQHHSGMGLTLVQLASRKLKATIHAELTKDIFRLELLLPAAAWQH